MIIVRNHFIAVFLIVGLALTGCQVPLSDPAAPKTNLTFQISTPAPLVAADSQGRLILADAKVVNVRATKVVDGTVFRASAALVAGQTQVTVKLSIPAGQFYTIDANAADAVGTILYTGKLSSFQVNAAVNKSLNLVPFRSSTLAAADQPVGGTMAEPGLLTAGLLPAGKSASYRIEFGTATQFTFAAPEAGLSYYLQDADGAALLSTTVVTRTAAGKFFWATYFDAAASHTLSTIGTFSIPIESISLASSSIAIGGGQTLSVSASWLPANATDTTLAWSSSNTSVLTVDQSGVVSSGTQIGSAVITANNATSGVSGTLLISNGALNFTLLAGDDLAFAGTASVAQGTPLQLTSTNTALQAGGTGWELYVGGNLVPAANTYALLAVPGTLPPGFYVVTLFVTYNGISYSGSINLTVTQ